MLTYSLLFDYLTTNSLKHSHNPAKGILKASALWANAFYKSQCPSVCFSVCLCVCLFVCLFTFEVTFKSWLELTPRSFVPLATLKSKVLPIQLAQDTAGS